MPKDAPEVVKAFLGNTGKLIETAKCLELPVIVTEQNPERLGGTNQEIAGVLGDVPRISKLEFNCAANDAFREALRATGRRQALVLGMETHICVMQTALGLKERGYEPYVAVDATVSMHEAEHKLGIRRIEQEGVRLVTTQMAIFELLRMAGTPEFKRMLPLLKT